MLLESGSPPLLVDILMIGSPGCAVARTFKLKVKLML